MRENKLLTAIDLDNNQKNINNIIEEKVIQFTKKEIRKQLKDARDLLKIENPIITDVPLKLSKEQIEEITLNVINSKVTKNFRENQYYNLQQEKNNYLEFRNTIDDLNSIDDFSVDIERVGLQTINNFKNYEDIVLLSITHNYLFHKIRDSKKSLIQNKIDSYKDIDFTSPNFSDNLMMETLNQILLIREMYTVDITVDDIDLYEKYELQNNIEIAHKISDNLFIKVCNGNLSRNVLNEFLPKSQTIKQLTNSLKNINDLVYQQVISNKLLAVLFSKDFISNNSVTTLETTYTNNINRDMVYRTRTLGELLFEITNDDIQYKTKEERQQIYMTYDGIRPSKEEYYKWNGLQVFDLDMKHWIKNSNGDILLLKQLLHEMLSGFHWYLWICTSASGKGLHIYTKVTPPHHVYTTASDNEYISQYWHQINYVTKLSNIYDMLHRLHRINGNGIIFSTFFYEKKTVSANGDTKYILLSEDNDVKQNKYVDNVVSRVTAGIRLAYDINPLINHNFVDLHVSLGLGQTLDGYEYQETIEKVLFRKATQIDLINENLVVENIEDFIQKKHDNYHVDLSKFVSLGLDINEINVLPKNSINYMTRYNVCNSLAALFGKDGINIAHTLLDSKASGNVGEINSFYSCAISNGKEPTKLGLEILKKAGIIKSIEPELIEITENNYKNELKLQIEQSLLNPLMNIDYRLLSNQYLSDIENELFGAGGIITGEKINIVFSPAGSGKTQIILNLAKQGKRVLLVLPYISVIQNKVENDPTITTLFDTFYGTSDIKDIAHGRNAVTTFDKFSRINYDKISKMFDYIFLDESHLLFTSSYRIEATSNVIKKIKELFYISSNDPFASKIVLMTGTETGESHFFNKVANIVRVSKPQLSKEMEFLVCGDVLDSITRLASKAVNLLNNGYKLMIPTNKGEIYSEKIIGMIEYLLNREVKYGYYKRSNTEQEICQLINNENSIGDYEIVFCSNYLSVGVDINDKLTASGNEIKFASLYLGNFSGYEIEQFNARIRKTGIKSIYCITTNKVDGTTLDALLLEPDLLLRITDEDQLYFIDDKSISGAKTEFIASYDPVLHKITTPGFSLMNGKIQFNLEEYELVSFENKYSVCMEHPIKVARELAKYGYNITVSTEFEGLALGEQEILKQMGIAAAKNEKIRKHNLLVGTYIDLIKQNTYQNEHGLEFTDAIEWIGKNQNKIIEDRELTIDIELDSGKIETMPCFVQIIYDVFATPQQVIVRSREALDKMYKPARYLIKRYSKTKALDIIYGYVDDNGILKQKNFQRAINLLKLIDSSEANELAEPITKSLEKMYLFVDSFETNKDYRIGYETYQSLLETWTNEYIDTLGIKINTKYGFDKIKDGLLEMLSDLATKQQGKNGIRFTYNVMPEQDSTTVLNRRSIDTLVSSMFNITENVVQNRNKIKQKHIVLQTQTF